MQVEGQHVGCLQPMMATGARVSNAYPTCPVLMDSLAKARVIHDVVMFLHGNMTKGLPVRDGDA